MDRAAGKSREVARRLVLRSGGDLVFVDPTEIAWIAAAGNYIRLYAAHEQYSARGTLAALEARLGREFVRVHRSAIVNVDFIRRVSRERTGQIVVWLKDGTQIVTGRYFESHLRDWIVSAETLAGDSPPAPWSGVPRLK